MILKLLLLLSTCIAIVACTSIFIFGSGSADVQVHSENTSDTDAVVKGDINDNEGN